MEDTVYEDEMAEIIVREIMSELGDGFNGKLEENISNIERYGVQICSNIIYDVTLPVKLRRPINLNAKKLSEVLLRKLKELRVIPAQTKFGGDIAIDKDSSTPFSRSE